ncbi:SufD family Fe-S cluster assembly protein [Sandarakinorhabdus rubra]|uniref:SufD family Fe-S cluster assembly protein n=1 Tax=Sandarakinorhabdus rubra TaxID=2672568 RepID=UPI0013DAE040|nr:SufD family Fe-S cluster assembly protein [Sandarakinorhabdus rubra]
MTAALPTRRDEAWRYSDLKAVARHWPVVVEPVVVPAGEHRTDIIRASEDGIRHLAISIGAGASYRLTILDAGRSYGRIALDVTCHEGADFQLGAVLVGHGAQTIELATTVRHVAPHATSRQIVRAVAGGTATTSYLGQVAVAREGQKTDASQSFKALLLNRGAAANAKPELEIFADDVKCAHGAAIGEIDRAALFYMASRGVPPAQARALMTRAFLSDALEGLDDASIEALDAEISAILERAA